MFPVLPKADETRKRLSELDAEERRYAKAYGSGFMSERLYKKQSRELIERRSRLQAELSEAEAVLQQVPTLSIEQLVAGAQKMLGNLDFTDKKAIIRQIVTNIKATQENVVIWSQLPVLAKAEVGFEPEHWYSQDATIPFKLTFSMPPLDKRTRGYTPQQIKELQETVGGEW